MHSSRNIILCLLAALAVLPLLAATRAKTTPSESDRRKAQYIFLEAERQKQDDNVEAFFDLTRYAHAVDPTNTAISYYYGYCLLSMHDVTKDEFQQGVSLMRQHVDAHPGDYYESMLYSDANLAIDQVQEALRVIKQLAAQNPGKPEILIREADCYNRLKDYRNAIAVYDSLESTQGRSVQLAVRKVHAYQALGDTAGALGEMHSLLATAPRNAEFNIAMASMLQQFGQNDSALYYLDCAQKYEPDNGQTYLAKAQYYNLTGDSVNYDKQIYLALTSKELDVDSKEGVLADYARHLLMSRDSSQRVATLFNVLLEQHPHEPTIRSLYSEYLVAKQDYKGAAEQLGYELDMDPTDAKAWHKLMLINMMDENYPAAIKAAKRALELNPDSIELYRYIAPAYFEMKQYDKALATYDAALEKCDSNDFELRSDLTGGKGDVYFAMGDTLMAFDTYEKSLAINPDNTGILNNYAYFLAECDSDLSKAESMSGRAVNASPNNSTFLDTYAWVFFKEKNYDMALFYIKSAIDNDDSDNADLYQHYGAILYATGKVDEAVAQWKKALEMNPDEKLKELLNREINDKTYYEK